MGTAFLLPVRCLEQNVCPYDLPRARFGAITAVALTPLTRISAQQESPGPHPNGEQNKECSQGQSEREPGDPMPLVDPDPLVGNVRQHGMHDFPPTLLPLNTRRAPL